MNVKQITVSRALELALASNVTVQRIAPSSQRIKRSPHREHALRAIDLDMLNCRYQTL